MPLFLLFSLAISTPDPADVYTPLQTEEHPTFARIGGASVGALGGIASAQLVLGAIYVAHIPLSLEGGLVVLASFVGLTGVGTTAGLVMSGGDLGPAIVLGVVNGITTALVESVVLVFLTFDRYTFEVGYVGAAVASTATAVTIGVLGGLAIGILE